MASGEKPPEGTATTSTTREKLSAFKNRAATHYTRVKQVFYLDMFYLFVQLTYAPAVYSGAIRQSRNNRI